MKRRIFGAIFALALCLGALLAGAGSASAVDVQGKGDCVSAGSYDFFGDTEIDPDGALHITASGGGYDFIKTPTQLYVNGVDMLTAGADTWPAGVSYDKDANILTLNGFSIQSDEDIVKKITA